MAYYTIHLFLFKCKYLLIIGLLNEQLFKQLDTEPPPAFVLNCLSCTSHKKEKIFWLLLQAVKFNFSMRSPYLSIVYSSSLYSLTSR